MIRRFSLLVCASVFISFAPAADRYWDINGGTSGLQPGAGTWDTGVSSFWSTTSTGSVLTTWSDNDDAIFRTAGVNSVTVSGTVLANSITQTVNSTDTDISGGTVQLQSDTGITNSGNRALDINSAVTLNSGNVNVSTVTGGGVVFNGAIGEVGGSRGMTLSGTGSVDLNGATSNTYTGVTTLSGSLLVTLNKTAGLNAIAGDIVITNGARLRFGSSAANQIANTSNITMSGAGSIYNGNAVNSGSANVSETIASFTATGGTMNVGTGVITVTGAGSFTGGVGNTAVIGNSGSNFSFGSLSLTGMSATAGNTVGAANSFTVYGASSSGTRSRLTIGSGGLMLNGSVLNLRQGTATSQGSRLVLNGNITTSGSSPSGILLDTAGGSLGAVSVDLSGSAGTFNRTVTVGGGGADLTIGVPIVNGLATTAAITKEGPGTLTLTATNTYNGGTTINDGTLLVNATGGTGAGAVSVTDSGTIGGTGSVTGAINVAAGGALQGGDGTAASDDLTVSGNVSLANDSLIKLTLGAGGSHSSLTRTGGIWTFNANQKFTFADLGAGLGTYDNIIAGIANPGSLAGWTITNAGWSGSFGFDGANIDLTLAAIPEPATGILILAALGLLGIRRRR